MDQETLDKMVDLLVKHAAGTLAPAENLELETFLNEPGVDLKLWKELLSENDWTRKMQEFANDNQFDPGKAKESFYRRIKEHNSKKSES